MAGRDRVEGFMQRDGLAMPILQAPATGACPVAPAAEIARRLRAEAETPLR